MKRLFDLTINVQPQTSWYKTSSILLRSQILWARNSERVQLDGMSLLHDVWILSWQLRAILGECDAVDIQPV